MLEDWQPRQFLVSLSEMDMNSFLTSFGATRFLLIDIEDASDKLVSGLFHTSPLVRHDSQVFDEQTAATEVNPLDSSSSASLRRNREAASLAMDILADRGMQWRFLAPITPASEGTTIGRNIGNSIILKHQSISRFHSRFDHEDDGTVLTLRDMQSKNGTWLNGTRIADESVVGNGDVVRFGQVEAMVCDAEVLWQIVHPDVSTANSAHK